MRGWQYIYGCAASSPRPLPLLAFLGLLTVVTAVLLDATVAIYGLVLVVVALLTTASWHAWLQPVREKHA